MLNHGDVLQTQYKLIRRLSQHPVRQTWLATDQNSDQQVVIKLLPFNGALEWRDIELFEREVKALECLSHPQVPRYLNHFSLEGTPHYLVVVQSYIEGTTLKAFLDQGRRFTQPFLQDLARQLLELLHYLHTSQPLILHRDIKPSNIILDDTQTPYLIDFGSVQIQAPVEGRTFTIVGTYGYAPIEQYGGRAVPASDLYALGATLIHLATGVPPSDLLDQSMRIQFRHRVQLDSDFGNWLEKMTDLALDQRFPSAQAALQQLLHPPKPALLTPSPGHVSMSTLDIALPEFADNPEPRVPVVLLLDTSASMSGQRIQQLNQAVAAFQSDVFRDEMAALRVEVAVVTFGPVKLTQAFVTIDQFRPPHFQAQGMTPLAEAILYGLELIETRKQVYRDQGVQYYRPWLFLVSDGAPNQGSPWPEAAQKIRESEQAGKILFFAVGVQGASMEILTQIAPPERPPLTLDGLRFKDMFLWLSSSLQRVSHSRVGVQVELPPVTWGHVAT